MAQNAFCVFCCCCFSLRKNMYVCLAHLWNDTEKKDRKELFCSEKMLPRDEWTICCPGVSETGQHPANTSVFTRGFLKESFKETVQMCLCRWLTKHPVIVPPGNQIVCCCCFPAGTAKKKRSFLVF